MMDWRTLPVALAFLGLCGLVLWHFISVKGDWRMKLTMILIVPLTGFLVWRSMASYQGWPTPEAPPRRALMLWNAVREPKPQEGDPGAIYLWLLPVGSPNLAPLDYRPPYREPRAYRLDYTRERHEMAEAAKRLLREGRPVMVEHGGEPPPGQEQDGGPGGMSGYEDDDVRVYELPPPPPPVKDY